MPRTESQTLPTLAEYRGPRVHPENVRAFPGVAA